MYKKLQKMKEIIIKINGIEIECVGFFDKGGISTIDTPSDPPSIEIFEANVNGSNIIDLISETSLESIKNLINEKL